MVAVLAILLHAFAVPASASADMNGFQGSDGDQLAVAGCTTVTDWECVAADAMLVARDATGTGDDGFVDGSKENAPETWSVSTAIKASGKADVRAVATRVTAGADRRTFLDVAFARADHSGDTYLGVELNQSMATWTNPRGASIPCRTDGDVLVSYEVSNPPKVALHKWRGTGPVACPDGASGTWTAVQAPAATAEAAMNLTAAIPNVLAPGDLGATLALGTFGEASLDLRGMADAVDHAGACAYFRTLAVKTRSSSDLSSSLQDRVGGIDVMARSCESAARSGAGSASGSGGTPDVTPPPVPALVPPAAGAQACGPDVTLSGTAEPGSTVTVHDGALARGFGTAAEDRRWSVTVRGVTDGTHGYAVEATDAAGNTSGRSAAVAVEVDATAPAAPSLAAAVAADGTVVLRGAAQAGSTVTIARDGSELASVAAGADGAYAMTVPSAPGAHRYTATASDACHTGSASAAVDVGQDPQAGTVSLAAGGITGSPARAGSGTAASRALGDVFPASVDLGGGAIPATACALKPFKAYVRMQGVRDVRFMVDGRTVKVVRRADRLGQYVATIDPRRLAGGTHALTARVTFRGARKAKTLRLRFRRCDQCLSRRSFPIRVKNLRRGERAVSAVVYVNGARARVVRGARLRSRVVLTNLPKGAYTVRIVARTNRGRTAVDVRRYRTCVPRR